MMNIRLTKTVSMMLVVAVILCTAVVNPVPVNALAGNRYTMDLEGMMRWMYDKKSLTDEQMHDLQHAVSIIRDAKKESFSKWYDGSNVHLSDDRNDKITDLSDANDALNLKQIPIAIENMKRINVLRQGDENYALLGMKDSYTNLYMMAVAATGAMRGAGLKRHSALNVSCECLSWGTTNGADNWYYGEKELFNNIKNTLGITSITSRDQIKQIEDYADKNNITIGHYTALFWSEDQVMGVGYTPYSGTSCYNASKSSNYREFKLYTIEEFESLVKEYKESCYSTGTHDLGNGTVTKAASCTSPGKVTYTCSKCGATVNKLIPATGHSYGDWIVTKEATCTEEGSREKVCSTCGDTVTESIPAIVKPETQSSQTSSGKPSATVKSEIVDLPAVKISKPKAAKKSMTIRWKKVSKKNRKKISGIQIQYSQDKSFRKGVKTLTVRKTAASSRIKKLASKRHYYVRVRAYRNTGGIKHVSRWSQIKAIKIK